jgi:beta-N-acetylhexosaminidase
LHGLRNSSNRRKATMALALVVAAALGVGIGLATGGSSRSTRRPGRPGVHAMAHSTAFPRPPAVPRPAGANRSADLERLIGQLLVGRYAGPQPSASFLARVRAGQLGGVILFSDNTATGLPATRRAIAELQAAARRGGNPPLLIMTDQEGGEVRRLPGPPELAPAAMSSTTIARAQGAAAGRLLHSTGVNVDLAPVADVERAPNSFLGTRSFGSNPAVVAARACAFARGLSSAGVAYTLKHFPGLGWADASTDVQQVRIPVPAAQLRTDYAAYRICGSSPEAMIMVSSAIYPHLTKSAPAVVSREIYAHELPAAIGQSGQLTISDALDTPALATQRTPAVRAIDAGLDLALFSGNERESALAYRQLLSATRRGALPASRLRSAVLAVEALKRRLR